MADLRVIRTSESGRVATFRFLRFPEVVAGDTLSSVSAITVTAPAGYTGTLPTVGSSSISGSDVLAALTVGAVTSGTRFLLRCTVTTAAGRSLTRFGYLKVEDLSA